MMMTRQAHARRELPFLYFICEIWVSRGPRSISWSNGGAGRQLLDLLTCAVQEKQRVWGTEIRRRMCGVGCWSEPKQVEVCGWR